jgi:hypothetical protein
MNEAAPAIFVAIEASGAGAAIRQSPWIYMAANVGHIVALMIFAGALAIMDLRMAGALAATSPGYVLKVSRRFAIAGFLGLALTGAVLFTAEASHVILNPVFLFKLFLIALGLANVLAFEFAVAPRVRDAKPLTALPTGAWISGIASLCIWIAVAAAGRTVAYF